MAEPCRWRRHVWALVSQTRYPGFVESMGDRKFKAERSDPCWFHATLILLYRCKRCGTERHAREIV